MPYLFLGIAVLAGLLLAARWFVDAEPKALVRGLKWLLIGIIATVALFLIFTGRFALALWALPALLPWIMRMRAAARTAKNFSRMSGGGGGGGASRVESAFLDMELDHESGEMRGRIRSGRFEGRDLDDIELPDLISLHQEYRRTDTESARLLAAYLDRNHPDWRDGDGEDETDGGQGTESRAGHMSREEALRVLGLEDGAGEDEIKAAHHRLIGSLHPDRGGSAYLASKINEARDVLLKS
jgi:hypothetical protein